MTHWLDGILTTVAGTGVNGYSGDGGNVLAAQIWATSLRVGSDGNISSDMRDMTSLKLIDGLLEVLSGIDAKEDAVVHQGVCDSETLTTPIESGEKDIFASDSKVADSSFGSTIVNFEYPVGETAMEIDSLVLGTSPMEEAKQVARQRIGAPAVAHNGRKSMEAFSSIYRFGRDENSYTGR